MKIAHIALLSTLAMTATAVHASGATMVDPGRCAAILPVLDSNISSQRLKSIYQIYTANHGWVVKESQYQLAPTALRKITISAVTVEEGQQPLSSQPLYCEIPTHWKASPYTWVNLKTPGAFRSWPTDADDDTPVWNIYAGIGQNGSRTSLHHRFAWYTEASGYKVGDVKRDLASKYDYLGVVEVADSSINDTTNALIALRISPSGSDASAAQHWLVRNGNVLDGALFPTWDDGADSAATALTQSTIEKRVPQALDKFLPDQKSLDLLGLDPIAVVGGQAQFTPSYCAPSQCFSTVGINKLLDDTLAAVKGKDSFQVELVFKYGDGSYAHGSYLFKPDTGFQTGSYDSAKTLSVFGLDWIAQYRTSQSLAP